MNQLADFNQICMDIIAFGHDTKLNMFWWPWSNFQGHCQAYKFKPKSFCLHVVSWTIGWNVTKFAGLYKLDRINSLLDFGDLDLIFRVTVSWLKLPPQTGLEGGGRLFSLKTLLYFYKIYFRTSQIMKKKNVKVKCKWNRWIWYFWHSMKYENAMGLMQS